MSARCVLLAVGAMALPYTLLAQGFHTNQNGLVFRLSGNGEAGVYAYRGQPVSTIVIPRQITDIGGLNWPVTTIWMNAFTINEFPLPYNTSLTSVSLPDSIKTIDYNAFWGCVNLQSLTIPNSVLTLGQNVLGGSGVRNIIIGSGVTNMSLAQGLPPSGQVFENASYLTNISVSSANPAFTSVNGVLFDKGLTRLVAYPAARTNTIYTIPNTVRDVSEFAFFEASIDEVIIPSSVTNLGQSAFNKSRIKRISIPESIKSLTNNTFLRCPLLEIINLSEGLTNIGSGVLATDSPFLKSLTIPSSVRNIESPPSTGGYTGKIDILFRGAPPQTTAGSRWDERSNRYELYYLSPTQGWPSSFAGVPTQLLRPKATSQSYVPTEGFTFAWTGSGDLPMSVERSSALDSPWEAVATNVTSRQFTDLFTPTGRSFYRASFR